MRNIFSAYRRGSPARGLAFSLTLDEFRTLTSSDCYYCGNPPSRIRRIERGRSAYRYNGLDRVDNARGYESDNVVPCCRDCNTSKSNKGLQTFLAWAMRIADRERKRVPVAS